MEIYLLHGIHIDDRMQYRESPEQSADLPAANLHVYLTYLRVERAGRVAAPARQSKQRSLSMQLVKYLSEHANYRSSRYV